MVRDVILPWYNAFRFFSQVNVVDLPAQVPGITFALLPQQNVVRYEETTKTTFAVDFQLASNSTNAMDQWIMAASQGLIKYVRAEMEAYRLYTVLPRLVDFIGQLTNW